MAGLAVGFGNAEVTQIEEMLSRIAHRGSYLSGVTTAHRAVLGQRNLRADAPTANPTTDNVPLREGPSSDLHICYDGEVGNLDELLDGEAADSAFAEERALLRLYREQGSAMLERLDDAVFALVITDGERLLAARDLMGIKTLFYGWEGETLYFASELKSLLAVTEDVHEFPGGHYMDETGELTAFDVLPISAPPVTTKTEEEISADVYDIIRRSVASRVSFDVPSGCLLSGGLDSSIVTYLASEVSRERFGAGYRVPTFALGLGESEDILSARILAQQVGSDHHELIVGIDELFEALPEVIYYLESFDPSLVRSAVANYLISKHAREQGIEVLLSGEGGDEMFCGYAYMKALPPELLFEHQMACFGYLHNNASLRLDRMNQCNSIRVIAPLISGELFRYVLTIPSSLKIRTEEGASIEKWILKKAFEPFLPSEITRRVKQEFSQGSGVADLLPARIEALLTDAELDEAKAEFPFLRSKEELYYFRLFGWRFGFGLAVDSVGQWLAA